MNTRVSKDNLRGLEKERMGKFGMSMSISSWHTHY